MTTTLVSSSRRGLSRVTLMLALVASVLSATGPATLAHAQSMPSDIVDTAVGAGDFTTLATALQAAGLIDTLKGAGPYTVFAPTDEAFAKLPAGTLDSLLANPDKLRAVLTYHVLAGRVTAADAAKLQSATTVEGEDVAISTGNGGVQINDATVTTADIMASNGVIHVIDSVILPPSLAAGPAAE